MLQHSNRGAVGRQLCRANGVCQAGLATALWSPGKSQCWGKLRWSHQGELGWWSTWPHPELAARVLLHCPGASLEQQRNSVLQSWLAAWHCWCFWTGFAVSYLRKQRCVQGVWSVQGQKQTEWHWSLICCPICLASCLGGSLKISSEH